MALGISTTVRNNRLTQISNAVDGGPGAATIKIYDGTRPATAGSTTTLLVTLTCSDPSFAAASGGTMTLATVTAATAVAAGTATWARVSDSTGTFVFDCSVGTSGADINLNSVSLSIGQNVSITSGTLTEGNA